MPSVVLNLVRPPAGAIRAPSVGVDEDGVSVAIEAISGFSGGSISPKFHLAIINNI